MSSSLGVGGGIWLIGTADKKCSTQLCRLFAVSDIFNCSINLHPTLMPKSHDGSNERQMKPITLPLAHVHVFKDLPSLWSC